MCLPALAIFYKPRAYRIGLVWMKRDFLSLDFSCCPSTLSEIFSLGSVTKTGLKALVYAVCQGLRAQSVHVVFPSAAAHIFLKAVFKS